MKVIIHFAFKTPYLLFAKKLTIIFKILILFIQKIRVLFVRRMELIVIG